MPDTCGYPHILLAFVIFLSYRRGGGFVEVDLEIVNGSQQWRRRVQYSVERDSTIQDNLRKCSAIIDERELVPAQGSYPTHASLCICLATDVPVQRKSHIAIVPESDQMVRFCSPSADSQTDTDFQTDAQTLDYIHHQLIMKDTQTLLSCIELVNSSLKDDPWFHRLSSVPLPRPRADNFLSVFRDVVQQHSEDAAIESWDKRFTYSELASTSTAVGTALRSLGVKRGDTVILALDWSSWAPVCILAIFQAGAAFCFIDPQETTERVDWYLEKVTGRIVLCDASNHDRLSACSAQVVSVQSMPLDTPAYPLQSQQHEEAAASDVAYVLFTSGSTGTPKTVLTSQQALSAGAELQARALGMSEGSRVLGDGPLFFAGVMPKLLFSFAVAACLCIPQPSQGIVEAANQLRTDFMMLTVGAAGYIDPTHFTMRQTICLGAEVVPASTAELWGRHHSLRVAYGASEVNGVFSGGPWEKAISSRDVGSSAAHRFWIVDPADHHRLMPLGWPGEVLIQSVALASMYQGNETATAQAFPRPPAWYTSVVKPQPSTTSAFEEPCDLPVRWYKTGDVGRQDPLTLSLEVLGRIDQLQLALPGGRVDVTVLEGLAQAASSKPLGIAVQLGVPRGESVPRLFAFLASENDKGELPQVRLWGSGVVQDEALRRGLRDAWAGDASIGPEYVVVVEGLPRLHTGKIWRHVLREWVGKYTLEELVPWRLDERKSH